LTSSLTESIKAEARRLGFELVGVTTPDPPPHLDVFEGWVSKGRHGKMDYLAAERARQRRADPLLILPECQSIVVLGIRYGAPEEHDAPAERDTGLLGRVAAYAWGADYHDLLPNRMKALVAFIEAQVGYSVPNRWYTDTGPLLERELAQRAGLGWIGKNTCLIHARHGSYFLLAEILLGIELDIDPPFKTDQCGTCRRCIDACPTSCILPDRTLDASCCISYLTIELKDAIPAGLRSQIGDWVFGCDICQQVCPWNQRFARPAGETAFAPRESLHAPALVEESSMTPQAFREKFKGSPIKRAKRRGYLRNVAVALGNSRSPQAVPALAAALKTDAEPLVRSHTAWALGQIRTRDAQQALASALEAEAQPDVREEIRLALRGAAEDPAPDRDASSQRSTV